MIGERLRRPMCGKPVAFRQDRSKHFRGYASVTHARRSLKEYR